MTGAEAEIEIDRTPEEVFDIIHVCDRRLEWDTLLRRAELIGGATLAGRGVRSVCTAKRRVGGLAMETEYVSFRRGVVAAVRLTNRPPFFRAFAATLRHERVGRGRSRTTYVYRFAARPRWLAPLLEPPMNLLLRREVRARLCALKRHLESDG